LDLIPYVQTGVTVHFRCATIDLMLIQQNNATDLWWRT